MFKLDEVVDEPNEYIEFSLPNEDIAIPMDIVSDFRAYYQLAARADKIVSYKDGKVVRVLKDRKNRTHYWSVWNRLASDILNDEKVKS